MEALGKILSTKDEQKESTRITKGITKLKAAYIGGVVNLETGEIKSVVLPFFTAVHLLVNQGVGDCSDNVKRIVDMDNPSRSVGQVLMMAVGGDINNHYPWMTHQLRAVRYVNAGNAAPAANGWNNGGCGNVWANAGFEAPHICRDLELSRKRGNLVARQGYVEYIAQPLKLI